MMRILLFTIFMLFAHLLSGQVASYQFEMNSSASTGTDPNITASVLTLGSGVSNSGGGYNTGSVGDARYIRSWSGSTLDVNDYVEVCLEPNSGYMIDLTSISFALGRSASGPTAFDFAYSSDNFATKTNLVLNGAVQEAFTPTSLTGLTLSFSSQVCFRIFGYNSGASAGNLRIDELVFSGSAPLPVTLTTFNAKPTTSGAMLEWTTASEENNDFFAVEMSRDAASFSESAQVQGNGTTESLETYSYEYDDLKAGTYYFRLRQVDFDGQYAYSDVVSVTVAGGRDFVMVSNTVADVVELDVTTPRPTHIMNMAGAIVAKFDLQTGRNRLDVSTLPNGMYILSDGISAKRFVK